MEWRVVGAADASESFLPGRVDRLTFIDAGGDKVRVVRNANYVKDCRSLGLKHLDRFFGGRRMADITEATITPYVARRQEQGAANGTINRELATIGPMMQLAYRHRKAARFVFIAGRILRGGPVQGRAAPPVGRSASRRRDRAHLRLARAERDPHAGAAPSRPRRRHAAPRLS
jgi:hypothetical protein